MTLLRQSTHMLLIHPYSQTYETGRLLFTFASLEAGLYQKNQFYFLEESDQIPPEILSKTLVITDEHLYWYDRNRGANKFNRFYRKLNKAIEYAQNHDLEMPAIHIPQDSVVEERELYKVVEKLVEFFPVPFKKIHVRWTYSGTISSFMKWEDETEPTLIIRRDCPTTQAVTSLIGHIMTAWYNDLSWQEIRIVQDMLVNHSYLSKHLKNTQLRHIKDNKEIYQSLAIASQKNYARVGASPSQYIDMVLGKLAYKNQMLDEILTKTEYHLLHYLFSRRGFVCKQTEISDAVWKTEGDFYSLQSVSKTVERVRNKIKKLGISKEVIHAFRGRGYMYKE